jgi:hypothetical protein
MTAKNDKPLVFSNGQFAIADIDENLTISGPLEPVDITEVLGSSVMYVSNVGPGTAWVKCQGKSKMLEPEASIIAKPEPITIDMIDGDSTTIEVRFFAKTNNANSDPLAEESGVPQ